MVAKFKSGDFHIINGVLQTAHSLFKRCVFHVHTMNLNMQRHRVIMVKSILFSLIANRPFALRGHVTFFL